MTSFVIIKPDDTYTVEEQDHTRGFATYEEALQVADWLNEEEFQFVAPLGKGSNKIGVSSKSQQDEDRLNRNNAVKRRYKVTK